MKHVKHRGMPWSAVKPRTQVRAKMRDLARGTATVAKVPNFHTHIGRAVPDKDGNELRIGKGKSTRIKVEYVPRFADPGETARVMVMAAARKAKLDARRSAKADQIARTEARRVIRRTMAQAVREVRVTRKATRQARAVAAGRRSWTLPRRLRKQVAE